MNLEKEAKKIPKVLVVDDDRFLRLQIKTSLKNGFEVEEEGSGSKIIDVASRVKPDIILLDLNMPNTDGYEALSLLARHPATTTIPVVCMSSDADENSRQRARKLGSSGFFRKPFQLNQLHDDLTAILQTIDIDMVSLDEKRRFVIRPNDGKKYRTIVDSIESSVYSKILVFSWESGEVFDSYPKIKDLLHSDHLIFLRIKPSLITRFLFIEDLSVLSSEWEALVPGLNEFAYELIFDDPMAILNSKEAEISIGKSQALWRILTKQFAKVTCVCSSSGDPARDSVLNRLARSFIGYDI